MTSPRPTMPAFDTHKAVKALCGAGFDDAQAEAVVEQINGAINENLVSKEDLDRTEQNLAVTIASLATKEDLRAVKEDLRTEVATLATKEDLRAVKEDLRAVKDELRTEIGTLATEEKLRTEIAALATKEELRAAIAPLATKEELRAAIAPLATKEELAQLELRMTVKMEELSGKLLRYMGGGMALVVALIKGLDILTG